MTSPAKPLRSHHQSDANSSSSAPNYISLSVKRLKELSAPACATLTSLSPSQRRIALAAVGLVFFWPIVLLALNLPWMLIASASIYAFMFGLGKLTSDAKAAAKEHLDVDVDEKTRAAKKRFKESQFRGKNELITVAGKVQEWAVFLYKTSLLIFMQVVDGLVTMLLRLARMAKGAATGTNSANATNQERKEE